MARGKKVTIQGKVLWKAFPSPTSKRWIGVCEQLNLCLEAESEMELRSLIPEAIDVLLSDLFEDNELDQYLQERGWKALNLPARPDGDVKFEVPWELVAERVRRDSERRAH